VAGDRPFHGLQESADTRGITAAALQDFAAQYGEVQFNPLTIVIAAYQEEDNIGPVLDEIPDRVADLPVSVVVVVDGGTDKTPERAADHGAWVCRLPLNRGHGVALRVGYRLAREHGARYIATLDADGQWDPADLPAMVDLLVRDEADFVIGSRQLGSTRDTDAFRNLGVRFFSRLASLLTGTKLTDTSSGLRAMRAEVTAEVPQTQPQYQTSELLIGALFRGFRVAEVPTTMRPRLSGTSKKGRNLSYGLRYARVMLGTWQRERRATGGLSARSPRQPDFQRTGGR
jgi:glycosyltransferase involved in cell wall biosynthesis